MDHWSTIYDIVDHGITGNTEKCRVYTELLIQRLDHAGDVNHASRLQDILEGKSKGQILTVASDDE